MDTAVEQGTAGVYDLYECEALNTALAALTDAELALVPALVQDHQLMRKRAAQTAAVQAASKVRQALRERLAGALHTRGVVDEYRTRYNMDQQREELVVSMYDIRSGRSKANYARFQERLEQALATAPDVQVMLEGGPDFARYTFTLADDTAAEGGSRA